jgi:polyisoprenoid-binding protein YceI
MRPARPTPWAARRAARWALAAPAAVLVAAVLVPALVAAASPPDRPADRQTDRYTLQAESRLWIDGSTSVAGFTCAAERTLGTGRLGAADEAAGTHALDAVVAVPVRSLDCGVGPMNRDLSEALRAERHPVIRFSLRGARVVTPPEETGWAAVEAWGTLALAGAERPVRVRAEGRRLGDGRVRLKGRHGLRMTDFGVEPPAGPLGLVRARDRVTVGFDLVAAHAP